MPQTTSRSTDAEGIDRQFLLDIVNGEHYLITSDSVGVFTQCRHERTIDGRQLTPQRFTALQCELRSYLTAIAARRRPAINIGPVNEWRDHRGRRRTTAAPTDLGVRLRLAVLAMVQSRRRPRTCALCQKFFFPASNDKHCGACRRGLMAEALRLEKGEIKVRKHRAKSLAFIRVRRKDLREEIEALRSLPNSSQTWALLTDREDELDSLTKGDAYRGRTTPLPSPQRATFKIFVGNTVVCEGTYHDWLRSKRSATTA